jgi:hypothetical protein
VTSCFFDRAPYRRALFHNQDYNNRADSADIPVF